MVFQLDPDESIKLKGEKMFELVKKTMFTGLGLAYMTKEKIEETSKELIEKWKLSEKEGKELIDDLKKKSDEAKKEAQEHIEKLLNKTIDKMNLATKDDLKALEKKLRKDLDNSKNKPQKREGNDSMS